MLSPRVEGRGVNLVADLIDLVNKECKRNIIDNLFYDFEAAIIKNMPLCRSIEDDILIWRFNLNGVYSLKSGYWYLHEQQQHGLPGPLDHSMLTPLWKKIWGLQVPNKVKHLAWKACRDLLPIKTNLIRKKVITESYCDVCKLHQEDVVHALSIAQLCNQFGGLGFNGIIARFMRAPLSLIFLSLFLQVIGSLISLLLCYGLYGIGGIIYA